MLAAAGCGGFEPRDDVPDVPDVPGEKPPDDRGPQWDGEWPLLDCDPLVPTYCGFPLPNNVFTVADNTTATGRRIALSAAMVPVSNGGGVTKREAFNQRDGFSPGIAMLAHLPGATAKGLPRPDSIERSLSLSSPTILLNTRTGSLVPHWSQLDQSSDDEPQAFMIRPAVRLDDATRYIVAIRHVVDPENRELAPSGAFAALRDELPSDEPSVDGRRGLYSDIFSRLEKVGVERDNLQLAWDFTTASKHDNTAWLLTMRDEGLALVGDEGPNYVLDTIDENWSEDVAVRIVGRMEVPLYLDIPGPGGVIVQGPDGLPEQNGTAEYKFEVLVPQSARSEPAALLQFGHGLFGSYKTVEGLGGFANRHNLVIFSLSWLGMSNEDVVPLAEILAGGDLGKFETLPSRLLQGHLNALLGMRMMMGRFVDEPAIQLNGRSAINPDERYYFGGSLGGIMGAVYMSITTDVERGGLGVPGQSFNLLLNRSVLFEPFFTILGQNYDSPSDIQTILAAAMLLWDRAEPTGFSKYLRTGDLPGTPPHEVLMQVAIGDHQVSHFGAHVMARTIGMPLLTPAPRSIWGIEEVASGHQGSAMIEHDFGLPAVPQDNVPMREGADPHSAIWGLDVGVDELAGFLRTGIVENVCDGPCDPD